MQAAKDAIVPISERLAADPQVKRAFLVRKQVQHLPEYPFYVLAVEPRWPRFRYRSDRAAQQLADRLASIPFPGEAAVLFVEKGRSRKAFERVPGSEIPFVQNVGAA